MTEGRFCAEERGDSGICVHKMFTKTPQKAECLYIKCLFFRFMFKGGEDQEDYLKPREGLPAYGVNTASPLSMQM